MPTVGSNPTPSAIFLDTRDGGISLNKSERHSVIERYLLALGALGDITVNGRTVREMTQIGLHDFWTASSMRESSLWQDHAVDEQLKSLTSHQTPNVMIQRVGWVRGRAIFAWLRSLFDAFQVRRAGSVNRNIDKADIIFVQYWPTQVMKVAATSQSRWESAYFRNLPRHLTEAGLSVRFLHLHADGRVTRAPASVRKQIRDANTPVRQHLLLTDFLSFSVWLRAIVAWLRVQRRWLMQRIETAVPPEGDLGRLWPRWKPLLQRSIVGSHAVRTALLTEMFAQVLRNNRGTKVWVTAFEGQGWESCLARVLDHHDAVWVPYLHTMMRPWDLRAHTFLAEQPPKRLALHGPHDKSELQTTIGIAARRPSHQSTEVIDVEALRYQHLSAPASESHQPDGATAKEATWLVVGGADCELSSRELQAFVSAIQAQSVRAKIVVRWHPQCQLPEWVDRSEITVSQEPLGVLALRSNAALMVGLAAPLDTYLAGVPSCSFVAQSGLAMSPIEENEYHHLALDAADAVRWMQKFEGSVHFVADAERFFNFGEDLTRWRDLIFSLAR